MAKDQLQRSTPAHKMNGKIHEILSAIIKINNKYAFAFEKTELIVFNLINRQKYHKAESSRIDPILVIIAFLILNDYCC
ncbi:MULTISPECIES: hypothetical protein [unclassified Aerococcus]|uniref:hypothetical protein n=1 Tax=unclassified Aerococcus TaxID=2618060 RepID=UPI00114CC66A|nr:MULTISPECIES: hypothetical protein [unclassified Aerococcus]MDK6855371.1 hypothetical protein [Aerococcus sp. UMB7533]